MMKRIMILVLLTAGLQTLSYAQQKLDPRGMNYIFNPKPNSIIYHDTLFRGAPQFQQLFYRHGDIRLIELYERHRSNKIAGQVFGVAGAIATLIGVSVVSSSGGDKGAGWALLGGGFAATLTGGYLTLMSQRNLQMAVALFNSQGHRAAVGIGVGDKRTGLVFKF